MRRVFQTLLVAAITGLGTGGVASAADILPRKAPPPAAVFAPNWSGLYIGAHVGGGWADKDWFFSELPIASHSMGGAIGGGQVGFNTQIGNWVIGAEGDISAADLRGDSVCSGGPAAAPCSSSINWLATITGRLGFAWGRALLYVKGGAAFADDHFDVATSPQLSSTEIKMGWTVGGGLEYALRDNWSARIEYGYLDFGRDPHVFDPAILPLDVDQRVHVVKFGVNYRVAAAPRSMARSVPGTPLLATAPLWTGFYGGVHAGYAWPKINYTFDNLIGNRARFEQEPDTWLVGGHGGYLHQWGSIVAGLEVSLTNTGDDFHWQTSPIGVGNERASSISGPIWLVTGRLGYAWQKWLAYGKAGFAGADVVIRSRNIPTGSASLTDGFETGWTAGAGLEYRLMQFVSVGLEYSYIELTSPDSRSNRFWGPGIPLLISDIDPVRIHAVMARMNVGFVSP
jgi:outer membrane immunogenic protein